MTDTTRLDAIRARLEAATAEGTGYPARRALIAAAPVDLAYLLDGLEAMRAQRDAARARIASLETTLDKAVIDWQAARAELAASQARGEVLREVIAAGVTLSDAIDHPGVARDVLLFARARFIKLVNAAFDSDA
jgi:hypothetical protein